MKAAYDYTKQNSDEVDLRAGEIVTIIEDGNILKCIYIKCIEIIILN